MICEAILQMRPDARSPATYLDSHLLNAHDGDVGLGPQLGALGGQLVVQLARAEDQPLHALLGRRVR